MSESPRLVSVNEACQLTGVSRRTLYNWMDEKRVLFIRTAGGQRRIVEASLFKAGNVDVTVLRQAVA